MLSLSATLEISNDSLVGFTAEATFIAASALVASVEVDLSLSATTTVRADKRGLFLIPRVGTLPAGFIFSAVFFTVDTDATGVFDATTGFTFSAVDSNAARDLDAATYFFIASTFSPFFAVVPAVLFVSVHFFDFFEARGAATKDRFFACG